MNFEQKYELVKKAYDRAYAKYSNFKVGALLIMKDGSYVLGCNIENASYGLTNCAERTALFSAYANGYQKDDILELVIMGKSDELIYPCGACRQVISELMNKDALVTLINLNKLTKTYTVKELLPFAFSESDLHD